MSEIFWVKRPVDWDFEPCVHFIATTDIPYQEEKTSRDVMRLIGDNFHSTRKMLRVWPYVRYAVYRMQESVVQAAAVVSGALCWHVDYVVTDKQYRNRGYAKSLLRRIENEAEARSIPFLSLVSSEELRPFYLKCGFTPVES